MPLKDTSFQAEAHDELARQIESLDPNAAKLAAKGFGGQLAAHLVRLIRGDVAPDMEELRSHGVDAKSAISVCEAVSARHKRITAAAKAAAQLPVPAASVGPAWAAPLAAASAPAPAAEALDGMIAMSMLHTICEQVESGMPACLTTICRDGWSEPFGRELVAVINAARTKNRIIRHG